jgi:hypothetical protein
MEQTNCALLPLDLLVHSYKTEFMAPHTCHAKFEDTKDVMINHTSINRKRTDNIMAKSMMARAIRGGVKVDFLLADAWFQNG